MNTGSSTDREQEFLCNDLYDFEILHSLKVKLGCSLTTIYRSIARAKIPVYYIPHRRSQVLLHGWDLWRLASTPAWQKHLKRRGYKLYGKRQLNKLSKLYADSDIMTLFNEGAFKELTLAELFSAVDCGLIPTDQEMNLPVMFIAAVLGLLKFELPRKA